MSNKPVEQWVIQAHTDNGLREIPLRQTDGEDAHTAFGKYVKLLVKLGWQVMAQNRAGSVFVLTTPTMRTTTLKLKEISAEVKNNTRVMSFALSFGGGVG